MDKIDVFFKLLEKAKDKKRKVTCYSHMKEIKICACKSEGNGVMASIKYNDRSIYEDDIDRSWNLFSKPKIKEKPRSYISGHLTDTLIDKTYYFTCYEGDDRFTHYLSEIDRFINEIEKIETEDIDKDYQSFLKREV
jgi:hypothetical protein|tara:strand:- start:225 stop:635 length:411 start_codon:yes stop_codon:yes gene_type:complete